jgi:hypothetical protein
MDIKPILDAAKLFLTTPQGEKLLKDIDIEEVEKVSAAIKLANDQGKFRKSDKTAEERKTERGKFIKDEKKRLKEEAGQEASKYIPYIQIFKTTGRIYDELTKEPVANIKVFPQLCVFPVSNDLFIYGEDVVRQNVVTKENLLDAEGNARYKAVRDKDLKDPKNFNVSDDDGKFYVKTDNEGRFTIRIGLPILDASPSRLIGDPKVRPFVIYKDDSKSPQTKSQQNELLKGKFKGSQYAPGAQTITTRSGEIPEELNVYSLLNIDKAAEVAVDVAVEEVNKFVIDKVDPYLSLAETFITKLRNSVLKPASVVQRQLLPLAIQLMIYFGIAKEEQANQLQSQCPSNERLADIIKKRNSIVKQINNIYLIIIQNTTLAFLFVFITKYLKIIINALEGLNIPLQFATYSITAKLDKIISKLVELGKVNKELKKQLLIALIFLIISLIIILRYLKTIDKLIEGCESPDNLVVINAELLALSEQATEQGSSELKIVNGFNMSVEVVDKAQVGELPRRQAIAKNSKGIIILRGEPSFSAEDQILIDELAFYIQINNLKAD